MRNDHMLDFADCTEFRQTIQARPPRIVHGTTVLLVALVSTAVLWMAMTQADLVVRAPGRMRPVTTPLKVLNTASGEVLSASFGGRVMAVNFHEGDEVRKGDVLIQLDTERVDNEIAKRKRTIHAAEEELTKLGHLKILLSRQFEAAKAKAEAELAQAFDEVRQAKERQASHIRLAHLQLDGAADEESRLRTLAGQRLVAQVELVKARTLLHQAEERLEKVKLPVDGGRVEVLRRALALTEKEYAMMKEELAMKHRIKQGEIEAAQIELSNLELQRNQAVIRAPIDGIVTTGDVKVGEILESGKPVVEIAEQRGFHFEAAVPSEEVGHLRVGMPARIKLDAYDYLKYGTLDGTVCFIAPDSGPLGGQRTAMYVVRIQLDRDEVGRGELRGRVKLGMAGQAEAVTGRESLLTLLMKNIRQTISLG